MLPLMAVLSAAWIDVDPVSCTNEPNTVSFILKSNCVQLFSWNGFEAQNPNQHFTVYWKIRPLQGSFSITTPHQLLLTICCSMLADADLLAISSSCYMDCQRVSCRITAHLMWSSFIPRPHPSPNTIQPFNPNSVQQYFYLFDDLQTLANGFHWRGGLWTENTKLDKRWPMYSVNIQTGYIDYLAADSSSEEWKKQTKTARLFPNNNEMTHLVGQYHSQNSVSKATKEIFNILHLHHLTFGSNQKKQTKPTNSSQVDEQLLSLLRICYCILSPVPSGEWAPVWPQQAEALYHFPSNHSQMLIG